MHSFESGPSGYFEKSQAVPPEQLFGLSYSETKTCLADDDITGERHARKKYREFVEDVAKEETSGPRFWYKKFTDPNINEFYYLPRLRRLEYFTETEN